MKTKEELTALRNEVEALSSKLAELSEDELAQVTGGFVNAGFKGKFKYVTSIADAVSGTDKLKVKGGNPYSPYFDPVDNEKQYDIHIYPGTETDDFKPKFGK